MGSSDAGVPDSSNDGEPRPVPGRFTLQGVVSEATPEGKRAVEGASVNAWIQESPSFGYSYWWAHGPTFTDSTGQFRLSGLADSGTVQLQIWREGDVQQCASPRVTIHSDVGVDPELVPLTSLSSSPDSIPPPAPGFRSISGRVLDASGRPVPRAQVDFEPVMDFPAAMTFSDADGRYLLCGIPDGETVEACAGSAGRVECVSVPTGRTTGVDITLPDDGGPG